MEALWFCVITFMIGTYVVLDGFDFGAGIAHLFVARTDEERRSVLAAIGPVWDGNEVWLLAGGGVLVYAFPRVYAVAFSGFYLPLMMVLWLLILRGVSIEFRSKNENPLWRAFWDFTFAFSSIVVSVVLGVALANVVRGVPIDASGYFAAPLFTNFRPGLHPGALDWYTVLIGLFALAVLAGHGGLYLSYKTEGALRDRSRRLAWGAWMAAIVLGVLSTVATSHVRPELFSRLLDRIWTWIFPIAVVASLVTLFVAHRRQRDLAAFIASGTFIVSMLAGTAAGFFPDILPSTLGTAFGLTVHNAATGGLALRIGLIWWIPAMVLALGYFTYLFRQFRGKIIPGEEHGY